MTAFSHDKSLTRSSPSECFLTNDGGGSRRRGRRGVTSRQHETLLLRYRTSKLENLRFKKVRRPSVRPSRLGQIVIMEEEKVSDGRSASAAVGRSVGEMAFAKISDDVTARRRRRRRRPNYYYYYGCVAVARKVITTPPLQWSGLEGKAAANQIIRFWERERGRKSASIGWILFLR